MPLRPMHRSLATFAAAACATACGIACVATPLVAQVADTTPTVVLRPDRVYDGTDAAPHAGWIVVVRGDRIVAAGAPNTVTVPAGARTLDLAGTTLLPGLIDAHSHVLLHPYNETPWDDQVLHEHLAMRVARATNHLRATLMAGFTTLRDLGTEGADDADVGLKLAVDRGVIPGPRLIVSNRAIVATGSYAPKGFDPRWDVPQGAQEADGVDGMVRAVRQQIEAGAEWIKLYADYRWGPNGETRPTFSEDEMRAAVETARSSGRAVVVHASTPEGMRRAVDAGVETIEHGDGGTPEVFRLMAQKGVALCPTLAAGDAIQSYRGWRRGVDADPPSIAAKRASFTRRTRCRRDDLQRQRRRRVRARRQRPRARAARQLRHDADAGAACRDVGRREAAAPRRPHRTRRHRTAGGSHRRGRRSDARHLRGARRPLRDEGRAHGSRARPSLAHERLARPLGPAPGARHALVTRSARAQRGFAVSGLIPGVRCLGSVSASLVARK